MDNTPKYKWQNSRNFGRKLKKNLHSLGLVDEFYVMTT